MVSYNPNAIKASWSQTIGDIEECFAKWGVKQWQVRPMREPDRRSHWAAGGDLAKVEITYEREGSPVTIDCAVHPDYHQNLRVLFFALDALRMNEVRGVTEIVKQAYGLLPAPARKRDPWEVLGVRSDADEDVIDAAFRAKAKRLHPDMGGSAEAMAALNEAYEAAKRGVGS